MALVGLRNTICFSGCTGAPRSHRTLHTGCASNLQYRPMNDTARVRDMDKPGRVALSRELGELLVHLSVALHRHSMYPNGHPSLGPAVDGVLR